MFARIMAVVLTVILLLMGMLSGIGWIALREQQTETVMTEVAQKIMEVCKLRQLAYKETLTAVLVHQVPFLCGDHAK